MENGAISDDHISASSQWDDTLAARNARLNIKRRESVWGWATGTNDRFQWLQVDLGSYTSVTGVATQGGSDDPHDNWVTKYELQYSDDGVVLYIYKGANNSTQVYQCTRNTGLAKPREARAGCTVDFEVKEWARVARKYELSRCLS